MLKSTDVRYTMSGAAASLPLNREFPFSLSSSYVKKPLHLEWLSYFREPFYAVSAWKYAAAAGQ